MVWYTAEAPEYPRGLCEAWARSWKAWKDAGSCPAGRALTPTAWPTAGVSKKETREQENEECIGGLRKPERAVARLPGWRAVSRLLRGAVHEALDGVGEVEAQLESLGAGACADSVGDALQKAAAAAGDWAANLLGSRLKVSPEVAPSGYRAELARVVTEQAGDPDVEVPDWLGGFTPLGISAPIAASSPPRRPRRRPRSR